MYGDHLVSGARRPPIYGEVSRTPATARPIYGEAGHRPPVVSRGRQVAIRAGGLPVEIRSTPADPAAGSLGTITGYASRFNTWSEILERDRDGQVVRFMESVRQGAYARSVADPSGVRLLFSHGHDPLIGSRPIATLDHLAEDSIGLRYAGRLLPTIAGLEVEPLLRHGLLGSSYRFELLDEDWRERPGRSATNPRGLPERTILSARVIEVGPTPFPAQKTADAGLA